MAVVQDTAGLAQFIRNVPDFPRPGVQFKDITTLLKEPKAFQQTIDLLADPYAGADVDVVVGMESRGFILAAPIAYKLDAGFVPVRKLGHLPAESMNVTYDLEYGRSTLEIHRDAIEPGQRVLVVDDLLATGGTVLATTHLIQQLGGIIVGYAFLIELRYLEGRQHLPEAIPIVSLITYD